MTVSVRDGKYDVAVLAGPRVALWPSVGVRSLAGLCAETGLTVGVLGGDSVLVRGVLPLAGTGGLVLVEDVQHRLHRIEARAVVRVVPRSSMPNPFPGWRSPGLIPIETARRLMESGKLKWDPATVVLGTGNRALRFATELLEAGTKAVYCVELYSQWRAKRFAGWEVERRRFEISGGKMIEATPLSLTPRSALQWELRLRDSVGIRVIDVGRVVSAGPFTDDLAVREYPPGSFLFELEQSAAEEFEQDVEGWRLERERGNWLAGKIIKALVAEMGEDRDHIDRIFRNAKTRLKRYLRHREEPFAPSYQGKWIAASDARAMRVFSGIPKSAHQSRKVAAIECFEDIPCDLCEQICPESAISIAGRATGNLLNESKCTGCGLCLRSCPSGAILMLQEKTEAPLSSVVLPWRGNSQFQPGEFASLVNRRGEALGSCRITAVHLPEQTSVQLIETEVPAHLLWEARGIRKRSSPDEVAFLEFLSSQDSTDPKVEIHIDGEKRLVRPGISVAAALFELGQNRPGDALLCSDGSCGLCQIRVDGILRPACQTTVRQGMAIRLETEKDAQRDFLCPCLGISAEKVINCVTQGKARSPEAISSMVHLGDGTCHGALCAAAFKRLMTEQGIDATQWLDWRFPWTDWLLSRS